jgi:hypothetical protein
MNYLDDIGYTPARQQLSNNTSVQLLRQSSTTSDDDLQVNNQYILEYNYFRAYARSLLQDISDSHSPSTSQRHTRRSWNYDASGYFGEQSRRRTSTLYQYQIRSLNFTTPVMQLIDNPNTNIDVSGMPHRVNTSLEEFMQVDYIISDILMRDFNNIDMSIGVMRGLNETEFLNGLIDTSYNSDIHCDVNTCCPIALDEFEENDRIKQIIKCGHIYKPSSLIKWFEKHTRCPLCRYDLRIDGQQRDVSFNGRGIEEIEREIDTIINSIASVRIDIDVADNNNNEEKDCD